MADLAVTAANVKVGVGGFPVSGTSGGAFAAGDLVAKDANGNIVQADANGAPPINNPVGIALNSCPGAGQPCQYTANAPLFEGTAAVQGTVYVASATPGKICPAADEATGNTVTYIGIGAAASKLAVQMHASGIAVP
jgi:Uncharacterized conserved protein (DUF2190)